MEWPIRAGDKHLSAGNIFCTCWKYKGYEVARGIRFLLTNGVDIVFVI
jgi:hypothetical protein